MTSAGAGDRDAIVRVVEQYVAGFNELDAGRFRGAFTSSARMQMTGADGAFREVVLDDVFDDWASPPGSRIVGRVVEVVQAGDVAAVVLGYDNLDRPERCYVDLLSLLRIDGAWRIVNKACTHASRGGAAGAGQAAG